jgi:hypothetical protein
MKNRKVRKWATIVLSVCIMVSSSSFAFAATSKSGITQGTEIGVSRPIYSITIVDKTKLIELVAQARYLLFHAQEGSQTGNYPVGSKQQFGVVIIEEETVKTNPNSTQAEVDAAVIKLSSAMNAFLDSVIPLIINKGTLNMAIAH